MKEWLWLKPINPIPDRSIRAHITQAYMCFYNQPVCLYYGSVLAWNPSHTFHTHQNQNIYLLLSSLFPASHFVPEPPPSTFIQHLAQQKQPTWMPMIPSELFVGVQIGVMSLMRHVEMLLQEQVNHPSVVRERGVHHVDTNVLWSVQKLRKTSAQSWSGSSHLKWGSLQCLWAVCILPVVDGFFNNLGLEKKGLI